MTGSEVLDVGREAVFAMLALSVPLMAVALAVGLAIALLQALTQVQEMTLVFVPKIVAMFLVLILLLPFMGAQLGGLMTNMTERIANMG